MDNYIQFPRYSIYLIPNKLFIDQVEKLLLKNDVKFDNFEISKYGLHYTCLLYTSPSPRDRSSSRMPSSA